MDHIQEDENKERMECANCGETENLLKCSRCHNAWFCGVKCQKQYWPFHKPQCKRNEFADAIEEAEPKFANWMRKHGKLAVLKDDEVDRLERANAAVSGTSRQEVMESMYGRLEPKPAEPTFTAEERIAMRRREQEEKAMARKNVLLSSSYQQIDIPRDLGIDCGNYKWKQSQSHVEIYIPLPQTVTSAHRVLVDIKPNFLSVVIDERPFITGTLYREVKADESTWYIHEGVLEILLLKRSRRGHYADGETNADTFWKAVTTNAQEDQRLIVQAIPSQYYWTACDFEDIKVKSRKQAIKNTHAKTVLA